MKKYFLIIPLLLLSLWSKGIEMLPLEEQYRALCDAFDQRQVEVQALLERYKEEYPYTPYIEEIQLMIAVLQTESEQYALATESFKEINIKKLQDEQLAMYQYHLGYCYLMQEQFEECLPYMQSLAKKENKYKPLAIYYYAYTLYILKRYDEAMPLFLSLKEDEMYGSTVPYYIVQMHYMRGDVDSAKAYCEELLKSNPKSENNGELHRILGEIDYYSKDYNGAISHLSYYQKWATKDGNELVRSDLYILGVAYFHLKKYDEAINYLKMVKHDQDTISESTYLYLGQCYSMQKNIEQAKLAYQTAYQMNITPAIKEEAMYNFIITSYPSSSALGESIQAFTDYLKEFPNSAHSDQIKELMVNALVHSTNYTAALEALEEINDKSPKVEETKQFLQYQLGTDAFVQNQFEKANEYFSAVVEHSQSNTYKTESYYWLTEIAYRLRDFDKAEKYIEEYKKASSANSPNRLSSYYLEGYIKFQNKKFSSAQEAFKQYVNDEDVTNITYADALNRLGDCAFHNREFNEATNYYNKVIYLKATGADYATFQCGYSLGLLRQYKQKMKKMESLVENYPNSDYADDALYELGRAALENNEPKSTLKAFEKLFKQYPNSPLLRKAMVEYAMTLRNMKESEKAIDAFKKTIEQFPGSDESYLALDALQQMYIEANNIGEFITYSKKLPKLNMQVATQEDSLIYITAELQYMLEKYEEAERGFKNYIDQFCTGGRYCISARYYLADCYYRKEQYAQAVPQYELLAEVQGNPYMAETYTRLAQIFFEQNDYQTALKYYQKMERIVANQADRDVALIGILTCANYLENYTIIVNVATDILSDNNAEQTMREMALYSRAKAYCNQKNYGLAVGDFTVLAREVRTAQGAEAKYLLAECYFELGNFDVAEEEIMSFTKMNTTHQYWLAKSMILLADIYVKKNDTFQAKQYLLSLQNNYKKEDDIQLLVVQRLQQIESLEVPKPQ